MKNFSAIVLFFLSLTSIAEPLKRKPVPALPAKPNLEIPYQENEFKRVDPHGSLKLRPTIDQVQQQNECLVCHAVQAGRLVTKANSLESCSNCHNRSPHSGVEEHLKAKVTCTSCHSFHRGDSIEWSKVSGKFKGLHGKILEPGFFEKSNPNSMLRKNCVDCHKW